MFEEEEIFPSNKPISKCEEIYYFCNCDKINKSWLSPQGERVGRRQPSEMKTRQRFILITFILSVILVLLIMWGSNSARPALRLTFDLDELTERSKCPACFGVNLCPAMISNQIKLSDWTRYSIAKLMNQKNVYYAEWNDRGETKQLILKKLAHDHELDNLDKTICSTHKPNQEAGECDVSDSVRYLIDRYSESSEIREGEKILNSKIINQLGQHSDILLCPSHRKMDYLIAAASKFARGQHPNTILANVLTTILLNPEPLLLQAFPAEKGWPFPKYFGSCGRIVAEEFVGQRLTSYYNSEFKIRANLAKQLLELANRFGENESEMILYLTDVVADNFAVMERGEGVEGEGEVLKVVDLENIIVVDKQELFKNMGGVKNADKLLVAQSVKCDKNTETECFGFVTEDLCQRPLTDHNYYAVCAGLLSPGALEIKFPEGLLHSIPQEDSPKLPNLRELLIQCKNPDEGSLNLNRVEAAQQILDILKKYLNQ